MQLIDFEKLVNELSDESFSELKARTSDYLSYYFIEDLGEVDRKVYLEKLGEYLKQFIQNNLLMTDKKFVETYYDELNSLIKDRVLPAYKADEFYAKATKLAKLVNSLENDNFYTNIEDYTKIFITIYNEYLKNREKVKDITFFVTDVDYDLLSKAFLLEKPEMNKEIKRLKSKVENLAPKGIKNIFNNAKDGVQSLIEQANKKLLERKNKKKEKDYELFSSIISEEKEGKHFSKRSFSFILMTIIYLRLKDFELGQ